LDIRDQQLEQYLKKLATVAVGGLTKELRPIFELMDAYDFFLIREGQESSRVQEVIRLLLSPELRPALRLWYSDSGDQINQAALEFRTKLSGMAGERLG
jgi:hypothetical protein